MSHLFPPLILPFAPIHVLIHPRENISSRHGMFVPCIRVFLGPVIWGFIIGDLLLVRWHKFVDNEVLDHLMVTGPHLQNLSAQSAIRVTLPDLDDLLRLSLI